MYREGDNGFVSYGRSFYHFGTSVFTIGFGRIDHPPEGGCRWRHMWEFEMPTRLDLEVAWKRLVSLARRPTLQHRVNAALTRAMLNGYNMADIAKGDAGMIAGDILAYDADFEHEDFDAVRERCQRWLDAQ